MVELIKNATKSLCKKSNIDDYAPIMQGVTSNKTAFNHYIDVLFQKVLVYSNLTAYVFCFSENNDLLSQWYEYADDAQGVAIGFNVDTLNEICLYSNEYIKLGKVSYVNRITKELREKVEDYAKQYYSDIERLIFNNMLDVILNEWSSFWLTTSRTNCLIEDSVLFKNHKFLTEQEWRMYMFDEGMVKDECDWGKAYNWGYEENKSNDHFIELIPKALQFKSTGNDIISFMDLSFERFKDKIIDNIIIGPNCRLTKEDVYQIMSHFGFESFDYRDYDEKIVFSKCPYKTKSFK